jgi:hypothetical protein
MEQVILLLVGRGSFTEQPPIRAVWPVDKTDAGRTPVRLIGVSVSVSVSGLGAEDEPPPEPPGDPRLPFEV